MVDTSRSQVEAEVNMVSENRRQILRSIHEATFDKTMSDTGRITTVIARFSTLLVSLSEEADLIQKRLIRITWAIAILTVILTFLTLVVLLK